MLNSRVIPHKYKKWLNNKQQHTWFILELLYGLNGTVVVVEVNNPHHLAPLDVSDTKADATDHVAVDQFHDLRRCRELRVDLRQLYAISSYLVEARTTPTALPCNFYLTSIHAEH